MSCYSKEKIEKSDYKNICKSHSARSDREMYRICPSKLSKRELEDLYFTLLENNLELKKTINGQQEKIRGLSTKVQRITTTQKSLQAKGMKECCVGTKAVVNEQKESITSLKLANQQMIEKIRMLNMRLCSAKQFCKKASMLSASTSTPKKHDCISKQVEPVLKCVSCQNVARPPISTKSAQTETRDLEEKNADLPCDENKCRTAMEELKQKIFNLEEELCQTHGEYSSRIGRLESEVSEVRKENVRVRSERGASEHELQSTVKRTSDLLTNLRTSEAHNAELATQLSIEKRKVAELETRLKSANMSGRVNKTIEDHLTTLNEAKAKGTPKCFCACHPRVTNEMAESTPKKKTKCHVCACPPANTECDKAKCGPSKVAKCFCSPTKVGGSAKSSPVKESKCACPPPPQVGESLESSLDKSGMQGSPRVCAEDCKWSPASDDSGYLERSHDKDSVAALNKLNQELIKRIIELQNQVDSMKISGATDLPVCKPDTTSETAGPSYSASTPKSPKDKPATGKSGKKFGKQKSTPAENRKPNKPELILSTPELLTRPDNGLANKPELGPGDQKLRDGREIIEINGAHTPELAFGKPAQSDDRQMFESYDPSKPEPALGNEKQNDDRQMFENREPSKPESVLSSEKQTNDRELFQNGRPSKPESIFASENQSDDREMFQNREPSKPTSVLGSEKQSDDREMFQKREPSKPESVIGSGKQINDREMFQNREPSKPKSVIGSEKQSNDREMFQSLEPSKPESVIGSEKQSNDREMFQNREPSKPESVIGSEKQSNDREMFQNREPSKPESVIGSEKQINDREMFQNREPSKPKSVIGSEKQSNDREMFQNREPSKPEPVIGSEKRSDDREMFQNREPSKPEPVIGSEKQSDDREMFQNREPSKPEPVIGSEKQSDDREMFQNRQPNKPESVIDRKKQREDLKVRENFEQRNETYRDRATFESHQPNKPKLVFGKPKLLITPEKREPKLGLSIQELRDEMELVENQCREVNNSGMIPQQRLHMLDDCESNKTAESNKTGDSQRMPGIGNEYINQNLAMKEDELRRLTMESLGHRTSKSDIIFGNPELATNINRVPNKIEMLPGNLKLPMTDGLTAGAEESESLKLQHPSTDKERCKNCSKCAHHKECATKPYCNKNDLKCDDLGTRIVQGMKSDRHNSLQIPGPIPAADSNNKDWKRSVLRHFSFDGKKKDSQKNKDKSKHKKTSIFKDAASDALPAQAFHSSKGEQANINEDIDPDERQYRHLQRYGSTCSRDSIETHHQRLSRSKNIKKEDSVARIPLKLSLNDSYTQSDQLMPSTYNVIDRGTQMELKSAQRSQEQEVLEHTIGVQIEGQNVRAVMQQQPHTSTSEKGTYTVSGKQMRGTSPDTECEISSMTDLPSETDAKSPVKDRALSPGEDKMTSTFSESQSRATTPHSLSEGELPPYTQRISNEQRRQNNGARTSIGEASAQKMEDTLTAISEELFRCKNLLRSQRPCESAGVSTQASGSSVSSDPRSIALRHAVATQSIGDTHAPHCIFTLHIGTVVLSDEAVVNSRNKNLVLLWQFYDQNTAMTRMRAGRVVLFDYSTEYDIKITDEFLKYMKQEEMPIYICELDKQDQPFATCTLPLRDALLHTNRRADMSLALLAGPQMQLARADNSEASDALDAGDEMGVIDLWCMLRADSKLLPIINRAISRPVQPVPKSGQTPGDKDPRTLHMLQQVVDDDPLNEFVDLDLSLERFTEPVPVGERTGTNVCKDVEYTRTSRPWDRETFKMSAPKELNANTQTTPTKAEQMYDPSKYPPVRIRRSTNDTNSSQRPSDPDSLKLSSNQPPSRDVSGIIINEVEAKIKLPGDLKHALNKSTLQNEFTRLPDDEAVSQAHSSFSSLKQDGSSLIENMRKLSQEERNEMDIYKKYDNISKLIGSNRAETSKKVTIGPEYNKSLIEEPQRDTNGYHSSVGDEASNQKLEVTVLWLALNEECEAMIDPHVQRVYVAYSFLGRNGADLETPVSLPKPKHYVDKCYFNFKKIFELDDSELPMLGHMARCRASSKMVEDPRNCIVFSVVSEPAEDPLGLESCEDIGYAYLYLGDLLAYSTGSPGYTEVIPVRAARNGASVCGVLAVRLDGLDVVRRCLLLSSSQRDLADWNMT